MKKLLYFLASLTLVTLVSVTPAYCQVPTPTPAPAEAIPLSPAAKALLADLLKKQVPPQSLELAASYAYDFRSEMGKPAYKLNYRGQTLHQKGEAPKFLDASSRFALPRLEGEKVSEVNVPSFAANLISGGGNFYGDIFEAIGLKKFDSPVIPKFAPYMSSYVGGTFDGKRLDFGLGLETKSYHLPFSGLNKQGKFANWLNLGANVVGKERPEEEGGNTVTGELNYRAFFGRVTDWDDIKGEPPFTLEQVLALAPNPTEMQKVLTEIITRKDVRAAKLPLLEQFIVVNGAKFGGEGGIVLPASEYDATLKSAYGAFKKGYFQEPGSTIYLETVGQWVVLGEPDVKRFKQLTALTFRQYLKTAGDSRYYIQLRGEHGRDRSNPSNQRSAAIASFGWTF